MLFAEIRQAMPNMPQEKLLRCQDATPAVTTASLTCQSSPGLAMNTSAPTALAGTGMRSVTGALNTRSCGVNS